MTRAQELAGHGWAICLRRWTGPSREMDDDEEARRFTHVMAPSLCPSRPNSDERCRPRKQESSVSIGIRHTHPHRPKRLPDARQAHNVTATGITPEIIAKRTKRHLDELEVGCITLQA